MHRCLTRLGIQVQFSSDFLAAFPSPVSALNFFCRQFFCLQISGVNPCKEDFRGRNCPDFQINSSFFRFRNCFFKLSASFLQTGVVNKLLLLEFFTKKLLLWFLHWKPNCLKFSLSTCSYVFPRISSFCSEIWVFVFSIKVPTDNFSCVTSCPINKLGANAYLF